MALTPQEQEFVDFAKSALPQWFQEEDRVEEFLGLAAQVMGEARTLIEYWFSQAEILQALGAVAFDPDWLNQHARDRGTHRQSGELDPALRDRLRNTPEALTRPSLLAAIDAILVAESVAGTGAMVELRRDKAFFGSFTSDSGTGGVFAAGSGSQFQFTPTVAFQQPLQVNFPRSGAQGNPDIVISGAASAANDGTFEVDDLVLDAADYTNAAGVAETDATVSWSIVKKNVEGFQRDGFNRAFLSRGYRIGHGVPNSIIVILPFGCTAGTQASVVEMLRQKKGAGIKATVECRTSP